MLKKVLFTYKRINSYEYWPFWLFYIPAYIYGLFLALKSFSFLYFLKVNPSMPFGGALGSNKHQILSFIHKKYLPKSVLLTTCKSKQFIAETVKSKQLIYPLIVKPNNGERGKNVELVHNIDQLFTQCKTIGKDILVQEYIASTNELGVLFYHCPFQNKPIISSVFSRNFLQIKGDGKHSVKELVTSNPRALLRIEYLKNKFKHIWSDILPLNEVLMLEPIGNHNRGTAFINENHLINSSLINVFASISETIPDFDYGRFDLKFESLEKLYNGEGIKILEVNGINSEPGHIYDSNFKLLDAYSVIFKHMTIIYQLAKRRSIEKNRKQNIFTFIYCTHQHIKQNAIK